MAPRIRHGFERHTIHSAVLSCEIQTRLFEIASETHLSVL
jgi:hypothetical protein